MVFNLDVGAIRAPDRPDVKITLKTPGLGQHGAELHYSALPFWQLCALKGSSEI